MKAVICAIVPVGVAGGLYMHGDLAGGEVYNVGIDKAYHEMSYMPVPPLLEDADGDFSGTGRVETIHVPDHAVKWVFSRGDTKLGTLVADARANGSDRTRISISYEAATLPGNDPMTVNAQNYVKIVGPVAMKEAVAAAIQDRPFNRDVVMPVVTAYLATHMDGIFQGVAGKMQEAADASKKYEAESAARDAMYSAGKPTASAAPMVSLPSN